MHFVTSLPLRASRCLSLLQQSGQSNICASRRVFKSSRYVVRSASTSVEDDSSRNKTAAMLVIGDEILNGSVVDSNTPWLAKFLRARGVDLVKVEFVPDNFAEIEDSVLRLKKHDFVFTSGGIGPTHDDITYEAIARTLGLRIELHQETVERMKVHYKERGIELNESRLSMANLPSPCEVLPPSKDIWVPLVKAENVYILPGIPRLFTAMIENHADVFRGPGTIFTREILTQFGEGDFSESLRTLASKHSNVRIGSYPNTKWDMSQKANNEGLTYRVKVVIEGRDEGDVEQACSEISKIM